MIRPNRRNVIAAAVSACTAGFALDRIRGSADRRGLHDKGGPPSPVAIVKAPDYSGELAQRIIEGIRAVRPRRQRQASVAQAESGGV